MLRRVWIAVLPLLILAACAEVAPEAVAGTWVLSQSSRSAVLPPAQQKTPAEITLKADGTFSAREVPASLLYDPQGIGDQVVTGTGTWKLRPQDGEQQVRLSFEAISAGQRGGVPYETQLNIAKGWSAITLYYFQGDADQAHRVEFEKKQ